MDFRSLLTDELAALGDRFAAGELAFLAMNPNLERPVRDRLAFGLSRRLPGHVVAHEWRWLDLAVLPADGGAPAMVLCAGTMDTRDLAGEVTWVSRYPEKARRDLDKLRTLAMPEAERFSLVLAIHRHTADARDIASTARANLDELLDGAGPVASGAIAAGTAYGVPIDVFWWLAGPVAPTQS